jgi:Tol biopolymer transport system component
LPTGGDRPGWRTAVSPDGRTLALAWQPKLDADVEEAREPDPRDLPQPRVSLLDLSGQSPPRVLVAPHGYTGGLAFSPDGKTLAFGGAGAVHLFNLTK